MKALFWILLLGNVIFFAVMRWGGLFDDQVTSQALPLHEEKIVLLTPSDKHVAASAVSDLTSVLPPASLPAASTPLPASSAATPAPALLNGHCLEWGEFSGTDLERATTALSKLQPANKFSQRLIEYPIVYWVYIPPIKDKAMANRKIAQLKSIGIEDYFIISEAGPWLNAISLGMFKTKDAAQRFLDELRRSKDIHSAQIGERASKIKVTKFLLNGLEPKNNALLTEIIKDFPGSELKDVACTLTR